MGWKAALSILALGAVIAIAAKALPLLAGPQRGQAPMGRPMAGQYIEDAYADLLKTPAHIPKDGPEFYFTRLAYTENGRRRRRTMSIPRDPYICPEFGGSTFFPRQGSGWAIDYPGADCKFMGGVHRLTGVRVHPNPNVISILDPDLDKFPYVYAVEVGGLYLSDEEAARLGDYLLAGGFLHVDDFWGGFQKASFETQLRKVFPERRMEPLPLTHEVFHTFYDIDTVMQIPNRGNACFGGRTWEQPDDTEPVIYGLSDDHGRLMLVATYNSDLGDAWEYMDLPCYPEEYSGQAYRMGINFMVYAMTH